MAEDEIVEDQFTVEVEVSESENRSGPAPLGDGGRLSRRTVDEAGDKVDTPRLPSLETVSTMAEMKAVLRLFDETKLAFISQAAFEVSLEKARERGDLDQLVTDAMESSFTSRDGLGVMPWVSDGILWAPGSRQDRSMNRHICRFVRVRSDSGDRWVWEHPGVLRDDIRRSESGGRASMRSMTLVMVEPGAGVDVVTSEATQGIHKAKRVDSFTFDGSDLERVNTRRVASTDHR